MRFKGSRKVNYLAGIVVGVIVFVMLQVAIINVINVAKQNESLDITNRYITFQNTVQDIVYVNITLLNGYKAYIETNPNVNQYYTEIYLDHLIGVNDTYIRNIGVIQDTTIVWNYPLVGNESSIGVDLAQVEGQRESILKTKETLNSDFQGPIELVQGGIGFIVRLPLIREDQYWGLISVVIDGEGFYQAIEQSALDNDLEISIYNLEDYPATPFYETTNLSQEDKLIFDLKVDVAEWKLEISPKEGWKDYSMFRLVGFVFSILIGLALCLLVIRNLVSHERTRYQANHDFLTGLYNRTFLDEYQSLVLSRAERQGLLVGFMIIDVNKFKLINDVQGHHTGDLVLKFIAKTLKHIGRANEAVFRLGGDEFLIIFPEIENMEEISTVKKRITKTFMDGQLIDGKNISITLSIGCSIYPTDADNIDALLKIADSTMYAHKSKGDA